MSRTGRKKKEYYIFYEQAILTIKGSRASNQSPHTYTKASIRLMIANYISRNSFCISFLLTVMVVKLEISFIIFTPSRHGQIIRHQGVSTIYFRLGSSIPYFSYKVSLLILCYFQRQIPSAPNADNVPTLSFT